MQLNITIELDNAAFSPVPSAEASRILADLATRISAIYELEGWMGSLIDSNGNTVGYAEVPYTAKTFRKNSRSK